MPVVRWGGWCAGAASSSLELDSDSELLELSLEDSVGSSLSIAEEWERIASFRGQAILPQRV